MPYLTESTVSKVPSTETDLLPEHQVHGPVLVLHGSGDEPEGMVLPPGLSLLGQASLGNSGHV